MVLRCGLRKTVLAVQGHSAWSGTQHNEAEQALRHWVISLRISFGTWTPDGSRTFTSLASIIETCRKRNVLPWPYIAEVIRQRHKSEPAPSLPQPVVAWKVVGTVEFAPVPQHTHGGRTVSLELPNTSRTQRWAATWLNQGNFFCSGQLLNGGLSSTCCTTIKHRFYIDNTLRSTAAKIFCTSTVTMLVNSTFKIRSDTGVVTAVTTQDYVDHPTQLIFSQIRTQYAIIRSEISRSRNIIMKKHSSGLQYCSRFTHVLWLLLRSIATGFAPYSGHLLQKTIPSVCTWVPWNAHLHATIGPFSITSHNGKLSNASPKFELNQHICQHDSENMAVILSAFLK